jgi:hypothetical protein
MRINLEEKTKSYKNEGKRMEGLISFNLISELILEKVREDDRKLTDKLMY